MSARRIDNVSAGYVFVYDAKTGDVLWTHEKIVEMVRGCEDRPTSLTEAECERVRAEAARVFKGKEVKALIAPDGFVPAENARVRIDPDKKVPYAVAAETRSFAARFADRRK